MVGALGGVVTRGVPGARGYDGLSVVGPKKLRDIIPYLHF